MTDGQPLASPAITLRPRVTGSIGSVFFGLFLGLVGYIALEAGTWSGAWWIVVPVWSLAAMQIWAGLKLLGFRKSLALHVTPDKFSCGETTMRRVQVTAVRKYAELHFKGVRVEFGSDAWLPISATHHEPGRVLRAFRQQGYPVE